MVALGELAVVDIAVGKVVVRAAVPDDSAVSALVIELMPLVGLGVVVETATGVLTVPMLASVLDKSEGDVVAIVSEEIVNGVADDATTVETTLGIDRAVGEMAVAVGMPVAAVTEPSAPQLATAHVRQV